MATNETTKEFKIVLSALLNQSKSKKQINTDIKSLEQVINSLRLVATFNKADTKRKLNAYIKQLEGQLSTLKLKAKIDNKNLKREISQALNNVSYKDIDLLNIDENKIKLKAKKAIADTKAYVEKNTISLNIDLKKEKLNNQLTTYLNKNSKIRESEVLLKEADKIRDKIAAINDKKSLQDATNSFQLFKSEVQSTGYQAKSTTDKIKNMVSGITKIGSMFGIAAIAVNNFTKSLQTLKGNDTILTEISKTSEMTKQQLVELGNEAFKTASKYGRLSSNYLVAVQEMARSGYEDTSKELGKLSLLAQSAGDMTAENANNFLLATDAAYKYSGSIEKLNAVLDGANYISNKNSASLTDLADGIRVSASFAANAGIAIDELTAAEGTMIATTKRSGSEMGRAFRSIILSLQKVSGEFDGEVIDEDHLKKVESRCHSLGVELEYLKDGVATLRNPMEILKDLAEVYNSLPDNSADKQGLISDLGGRYHANALSSLLSRWDLYEKMLVEYSQGAGSALEEANKTADSWEGRLNSMQNSWDSFVNSLTNKNVIKGGISFLDNSIQAAETLVNTLGEIPVLMTAINTAMVTMNKDYGLTQVVNPETNKIDIQGNVFGIDFSAIKAQKKHFEDAGKAISYWNKELNAGKTDLETFNSETVKNNAQLKDYLSTCSKDAPASLSGYKAYLNAAGVATDALRLKTILLNSAISLGIGVAIQVALEGVRLLIKGIDNIVHATEKTKEKLEKANKAFEETVSEIEKINSELETTKKRIDELNAKYTLSLVEQQELNKLIKQNDELERELRIKEKLKELEQDEVNESAKDYFYKDARSMGEKFTSTTGDSVTLLEKFVQTIEEQKARKTQIDEFQKEYDRLESEYMLAEKDGNYEKKTQIRDRQIYLKRYLKEARKSYEEQEKWLSDTYKDFIEQDDGITDTKLLEDLNSAYDSYDKYLDEAAWKTKQIEGILSKTSFEGVEDKLVNLGKAGTLSVESITAQFPELIEWLEKAGISVDEFYQHIMNKANPDAVNYDEVRKQLMESSGIRNGNVNSASEAKIYNALQTSGILTNDGLKAYLTIKSKFTDGETEFWSVNDWIHYIREELDKVDLSDQKEILPITQTISDLKDLNSELDNLGSAIANLDDEGKFNLGDLDSIADYFLGLEDVSYDIDAVNNALKSLGSGNATLEEQANSINTLADQYLKTSGILEQVNFQNAELVKMQLKRMGISNSEQIVDTVLNGTLQSQAEIESILAQYKSIVTGETLTLTNVTAQEIQTLLNEGMITTDTANQMAVLAIKKQLVNGTTLDTSADINNLIALCQTLGATTTALDTYNKVKNGANGMPTSVIEQYRKDAEKELQNAIKVGTNSLNAVYNEIPQAIYDGGSNVAKALDDANKAASSSASETEDTYEDLFDFFERRIDVLNQSLELLNTNLENVIGSNAKNQLIDAQIGINKESINNYTDAIEMYQQKASEALSKIPVEFQAKIVDGSVSITDFIGSGNKDLVEAIKDYQNWADKISDCKKELANLKEELRQLELDKFNNIIEDFTNQFDISTNAQDLIQKQIDLFKEAGELIGENFYTGLIKESESQLSILEKEKQALVQELNSGLNNGLIEIGTDEWLEMVNALNEVDGAIIDCKKDIEEFNNSIQELHWDIIERIQNNFDNLSDEIKNLVGLIDDIDVSDKKGVWSAEGLTQLGLYTQEYERAIYSAKKYAEEIDKLNQAYINGEYSAKEYSDKLEELKKKQWDEINVSESAKDAIMDLNKARVDIMIEGIEEEIDAMKELIDAKLEALDAEKDLNDYRQSLVEKNKSVTDLERQIAAMQNDNTAATVAKRKKLEDELAKAKQERDNLEYEHSIDLQKDALNQQYQDFENEKNAEIEALKTSLLDKEAVIYESFERVKENANIIGQEITDISLNYGVQISNSLTDAWQSGSDAIASYDETLKTGESQFVISLDNMVSNTYALQEQADSTAASLVKMYNTNSSKLQSDLVNSYYSISNVNAVTQALNASLVNTLDRGYDVSSLVNQINSIGSSAASAANSVNALMAALAGSKNTQQYTYQPYAYSNLGDGSNPMVMIKDGNGNVIGYDTLNNAKSNWNAVPKYASGTRNSKGNIIITDEKGYELKLPKLNNGQYTIANEGSQILTKVQTDNIFDWSKINPNDLIQVYNPLSNMNFKIPEIVNRQQPSVQIHYDNLVQVQGDVNNSNIRQMEQIVDNAITKQFNQFNSDLYKAGVR